MFSEKDDKSKPLIEMFLEDESIRYDPTLYIKEFFDYSCLLVIGGYRKSNNKNSSYIYPLDSIKGKQY